MSWTLSGGCVAGRGVVVVVVVVVGAGVAGGGVGHIELSKAEK